jgi:hypothetical protein
VIPEEYLEYGYIWKALDGNYLQEEQEEESQRRLVEYGNDAEEQHIHGDKNKEDINPQLQFVGYDNYNVMSLLGTFFIFFSLKII